MVVDFYPTDARLILLRRERHRDPRIHLDSVQLPDDPAQRPTGLVRYVEVCQHRHAIDQYIKDALTGLEIFKFCEVQAKRACCGRSTG